ncbi:MAG: UDP-N-acetylmuramate--L-alanine ligase, partial [Nitriliruptorales bacterium]
MSGVDLSRPRRVHLVGVGGAGMSGIARMLIQRGHGVSGSDRQESRTLERLRALGAEIRVGHEGAAVEGADVVVRSSAIPDDNPELTAAREAGITLLHRSEMLAALMEGARAVLVAGTHGKTTTTSMLVVALQAAGADPSFAIGGALNEAGSNAHAGGGDLFVAEADESDRSFLSYRPDLAIVTNVGLDHTDAFSGIDDAIATFADFLGRRTEGAPALVCIDDEGSARLTDRVPDVVTYGEDARADLRVVIQDGGAGVRPGTAARLSADGAELAEFSTGMPGRHNVLNAAAALGACHLLGLDLPAAAEGLKTFRGPLRRFQPLGSARGVEVIDDYAHNPTKLRAT